MEHKQKKIIKLVIVILAVLLGISLLALGGTLIYNRLANNQPATVTVPDNLITPDADVIDGRGEQAPPESGTQSEVKGSTTLSAQSENSDTTEASDAPATTQAAESTTAAKTQKETQRSTAATTSSTTSYRKTPSALALSLSNKQDGENTAFRVENMFPGDAVTKYFRVQVSYRDTVTVRYSADVRQGYEKLAEVLKVRIKLLSSDLVLYDGLMKDMPESVEYKLSASGTATDELYYEITAYLDTSVGNDYQNKDLIADFRWWAEEAENLEPLPPTGDDTNIVPWACIAAISGLILLLLLFVIKRKEEEERV